MSNKEEEEEKEKQASRAESQCLDVFFVLLLSFDMSGDRSQFRRNKQKGQKYNIESDRHEKFSAISYNK